MVEGVVDGVSTSFEVLGGIAGLAVVLAVAGGLAALARRRTGELPYALVYLPLAALAAVLGVTGIGVVTFADSTTPHVSVLLLAAVVAPIALGSARARTRRGLPWMEAVSATTMAWGLPYLLGLVATGALTVLAVAVLDPTETGTAMGPFLLAAALGGGATTVAATIVHVDRLSRWMPAAS